MPPSTDATLPTIPEMVVMPGDDPAVCLGCDLSCGCSLIFPRCLGDRAPLR